MTMTARSQAVRLNLDLMDFRKRWQKARISAIRKADPKASPYDVHHKISEETEAELLKDFFQQRNQTGSDPQNDILLKNIFDHSRLLALSLSKNLGLTFEIQDFRQLLAHSEIPCFQGQWESRSKAEVLTRQGCQYCPQSGADICNYWREAVDGLVMGLGDSERFSRHASVRHGDSSCVDVIFTDSANRAENGLAWGPVPDHMSKNLGDICQDFEGKMKVPVLLKGLNEGVLFFEFKASTDRLCGGGKMLTQAFERKVQKFYPGLAVQEITPRAVMGGES